MDNIIGIIIKNFDEAANGNNSSVRNDVLMDISTRITKILNNSSSRTLFILELIIRYSVFVH